jgi:hypothetical protein
LNLEKPVKPQKSAKGSKKSTIYRIQGHQVVGEAHERRLPILDPSWILQEDFSPFPLSELWPSAFSL